MYCTVRDGPSSFVSAAIHGDELNGTEIIRRLLKQPMLKQLRGTLLAVPIINVHGLLHLSRYLPTDGFEPLIPLIGDRLTGGPGCQSFMQEIVVVQSWH